MLLRGKKVRQMRVSLWKETSYILEYRLYYFTFSLLSKDMSIVQSRSGLGLLDKRQLKFCDSLESGKSLFCPYISLSSC